MPRNDVIRNVVTRPITTREDIARQLVFTVKGPGAPARIEQILNQLLDAYPSAPITHWSFESGEVTVSMFVRQFAVVPPQELIDQVNESPLTHAERNMAMAAAVAPDDPLYQDHWAFYTPQWPLRRMSAEAAWDCAFSLGSTSPIVAVIDSGIAHSHPDLAARVHPGSQRFIGGVTDNVFEDEDGHGTFLAGTIGAITDNAIGIASAVWPITMSLLALKFYDPWNPLNAANAAQAIAYAVASGAKVINASWHVGMFSQLLFDHVEFAGNPPNDVLFVAAGGNEGTNNDDLPIWPANFNLPNVISVMATDRHDNRPSFSNYGPSTVHIAAPGVGILSTHYYLSYLNAQPPRWRNYAGTSAAAAHVTAAAALVRAFRPNWTATQVRAHLIASVDPVGDLKCIAGGRLNLEKAICTL
jgi:subtilase family protein